MSREIRATPLTQYVAERVRVLRKDRHLSGTQLAERVNAYAEHLTWDRFNVTNLETGRRGSLSLDEVYALATALGVSPGYLLPPIAPPTLGQVLGDAIAVMEALREGLAP